MTVATADMEQVESDDDNLESAAMRMFELDALSDSLVSGRLCGQAVHPTMVELMLVLLERLEWAPDTRQLAGALPHFPEIFGLAEFRSALANLGFKSTEAMVLGSQLGTCPPETLVCDPKGELWLIRAEGRRSWLVQPSDDGERKKRVSRQSEYRTFQFEKRTTDEPQTAASAGNISWTGELLYRFAPELRLLVALTLLSGATAILMAFGIIKIFDTVIPTRNLNTLKGILAGLLLLFFADFTFRRIRADIVGRISAQMSSTRSMLRFILAIAARIPIDLNSETTVRDKRY